MGCGGRNSDARRAALKRTAKSCGPDAPTLASRSRVYPASDGGKKARSPGRSRISRKTIAWGMPDVSGASAVNTRVHTKTTKRTRGCGCIVHPAFPAPSDFRMAQSFRKTRTHRAARTWWCVFRHCEERSDEAIHSFFRGAMDCFASLAMTALLGRFGSLKIESGTTSAGARVQLKSVSPYTASRPSSRRRPGSPGHSRRTPRRSPGTIPSPPIHAAGRRASRD